MNKRVLLALCIISASGSSVAMDCDRDIEIDIHGCIDSQFHLHAPSLIFLAAKNLPESSIEKLPYAEIQEYATWVKKTIAYYEAFAEPGFPGRREFPDSYDCLDAVFHKINEHKNIQAAADFFYRKIELLFLNVPLTKKALIMHGVPFYPDYKKLKGIRQEIPDDPDRALSCINCGDISPKNALIKAVCLDHPETLAAIIACHQISNYDKKVAFRAAVEHSSLKNCRYIFDRVDGFTQKQMNEFFCEAAVENFPSIATFLLERGANMHNCSEWLLSFASEFGYLEIVRVLLKYGADARAPEGQEALRLAGQQVHSDEIKVAIIRELCKHGADLNILEQEKQEDYRKLLAEYPEQEAEPEDSSSGGQK